MTESAPLHLPSSRILTSSATQLLYATTLFLSAFLLFWVQPMFAKMTLPLLGGSPSVWTTAMLFFQSVLLAGYTYSHFISRRLLPRRQILTHLCVIAFGLIALPVAVTKGVSPPIDGAPALWLIGYYTMCIGAPFFALSATAPLLQRWFSLCGHHNAADPLLSLQLKQYRQHACLAGLPDFFGTRPPAPRSERVLDHWLCAPRIPDFLLWSGGFGGLVPSQPGEPNRRKPTSLR